MIIMASQELIKKLCARTQKNDQLPKTDNMVLVSSKMSQQDHTQFSKGLASVFVDIPHITSGVSQIFSVRPNQMVPRQAVIQRDEQSQLVGISAVSGG